MSIYCVLGQKGQPLYWCSAFLWPCLDPSLHVNSKTVTSKKIFISPKDIDYKKTKHMNNIIIQWAWCHKIAVRC